MKLSEVQLKKLKALARSTKGSFLVEYLELVKGSVSDIRETLNVKPELEREVRITLCNLIDELLIEVLKRHASENEAPVDSYN